MEREGLLHAVTLTIHWMDECTGNALCAPVREKPYSALIFTL
jgi:hypothetical protein